MLSKEEIKKAKECLQETIQNTYAEGKAIKLNNALEYIDQLESDKQKITEKLLELEFKKSSCVNMTEVGDIYEEFVQELEKILKFEDFLK